MSAETEREVFAAWLGADYLSLSPVRRLDMWQGWQARAALASQPAAEPSGALARYLRDVQAEGTATERVVANTALKLLQRAAAVPAPANQPQAINAEMLETLKHLVRWHDQLGPSDINGAKTVIERATGSTKT